MKVWGLVLRACCFLLTLCNAAALLGIDFGDNFLKSTLVAPGIPFEIVLTLETKRKEPASVALKSIGDGDFERSYGFASIPVCSRFPHTCVSNLKNLLGFVHDDKVESYLQYHSGANLVRNNKRHSIDFKFGKTVYQTEEVAAMLIAHVKDRAETLLKQTLKNELLQDVVLAVPSHFNQNQRLALIHAAKIAGFKSAKLVDDGLAVAINYATNNIRFDKPVQRHLIYDMGATSTKATLVRFNIVDGNKVSDITVEDFQVDETLGGEFFTGLVYKLLQEKFIAKHNVNKDDFLENRRSMIKLWQMAEKVKLVLSANNEATNSVESLYNDIDFRTTVQRLELEGLMEEHKFRITKPIIDIMDNNDGISERDIDSVLLFGGSTRVPLVQKELISLKENKFHDASDLISKNVNSDEAATLGSTLRGVILNKMFRSKDFNISENSFYSYLFDYSVDGKKRSENVECFSKGSKYDDSIKIELSDLANVDDHKNLSISLFEDETMIETNVFKKIPTDIKSATEKLDKFHIEDCKASENLKYFAFFKMDQSRIFQLENVTVQCIEPEDNKGFMQKILGNSDLKEDEQLEDIGEILNDTVNSTESKLDKKNSNKKKIKNLFVELTVSKTLVGHKPLTPAQIDSSRRKLRSLAFKEQERFEKTELLNSLESDLYSVRSLIEDNEETGEDSKILNVLQTMISEELEWVEDQTYDIQNLKVVNINEKIEKLNTILTYLNEPVSVDDFVKLQSETSFVHQQIKQIVQESKEKIDELQDMYFEKGFTEAQFQKDKSRFVKLDEVTIESQSLSILESLDKLAQVIDTKKDHDDYEDVEELLESLKLFKEIEENIKLVKKQIGTIEKDQKRSKKSIERALENRIKKREEKEVKLNEEKANEEEPLSVEPDQQEPENSSTQEQSEQSSVVHDEL